MATVPEVKKVPVTLKRDYWVGKGSIDKTTGYWVEDRHKAGETMLLDRAEAQRLIENNAAERADPLP